MCLAHGLKRAGISVSVYERDRTRSDGLHGYRVGIDPTGNRTLRECLSQDLLATFLATCVRAPKYLKLLTENEVHRLYPASRRGRSHRERATRRSC
jgi:hypothetical protein